MTTATAAELKQQIREGHPIDLDARRRAKGLDEAAQEIAALEADVEREKQAEAADKESLRVDAENQKAAQAFIDGPWTAHVSAWDNLKAAIALLYATAGPLNDGIDELRRMASKAAEISNRTHKSVQADSTGTGGVFINNAVYVPVGDLDSAIAARLPEVLNDTKLAEASK